MGRYGVNEHPRAVSGGDQEGASALGALIEAAASGQETAWRELVNLYSRRVFALARSRVRDPELAEEITQSVFATLAQKLPTSGYREEGKFEPWLFRITINRVRDEARRKSRKDKMHGRLRLVTPESSTESVEQESGSEEPKQLDALRRAMKGLNDADREIIELRHHASMGFKEIAALLDQPLGTLLARHHRALRKLRAMIEAEQESKGPSGPDGD